MMNSWSCYEEKSQISYESPQKRYGQFTKRYIQSPGSIADSTVVSSTSSIMSSGSQGDSVLVSNVRGWTQTGTSTYNKILKYLSTI